MEKVVKFFEKFFGIFDEASSTSMMRFLSFVMMPVAIAFFKPILNSDMEDYWKVIMVLVLFGFVFFPKVLQKKLENTNVEKK